MITRYKIKDPEIVPQPVYYEAIPLCSERLLEFFDAPVRKGCLSSRCRIVVSDKPPPSYKNVYQIRRRPGNFQFLDIVSYRSSPRGRWRPAPAMSRTAMDMLFPFESDISYVWMEV